MKKFIKIITIFGMTTLISPVHSMQKHQLSIKQEQQPLYSFNTNVLTQLDPFSENFPIFTRTKISSNLKEFTLNKSFQKAIVLPLATIKLLKKHEEHEEHDDEKILEKIYNIVSEGSSVSSMYNITPDDNGQGAVAIISPSQTPISVYNLIKNWFGDKGKKDRLIVTIFKGKLNREEKLSCALTDELEIDVPEDIIHLLLSYLPGCNLDEEKKNLPELLAQARKEFDEQ